MKKIAIIFVAVILASAILFGIAMGVKKYKENNALATADTVVDVSNEFGSMTVNESVVAQMLGQYSNDVLGTSKPVNEYIMKLSECQVNGESGCKVELYLTEEAELPSATFAIVGYNCFKLDVANNTYLLLTQNGAFEVEEQTTGEETTLFYDEENNEALQKMFKKYSKDKLGFEKELTEYIMVTSGATVKAVDGKKVYIIKIYEQDGTETNYTCAFRKGAVYKYDAVQKQYIEIKK
ncbi:MAG: hypothetical protein E7522_11015 [Ruminococcaceae bacterium]|nr:hypothetical protein [Oscillospiraceae bacterium]